MANLTPEEIERLSDSKRSIRDCGLKAREARTVWQNNPTDETKAALEQAQAAADKAQADHEALCRVFGADPRE